MGTWLLTVWHWETWSLLVSLLQHHVTGLALPASLSVRLPHQAVKGRNVLSHLDEGRRDSPRCTQKCLCWLTKDQSWLSPQKTLPLTLKLYSIY